jgi:putative heme iron utilization protein
MDGTLTAEQAAAICAHMNEDHADAIAAYARVYGKIARVETAEMLTIDEHAMELGVETGGTRIIARVAFDHVLRDSGDARDTLIAMARNATAGA